MQFWQLEFCMPQGSNREFWLQRAEHKIRDFPICEAATLTIVESKIYPLKNESPQDQLLTASPKICLFFPLILRVTVMIMPAVLILQQP
jgi:hypothetical protein